MDKIEIKIVGEKIIKDGVERIESGLIEMIDVKEIGGKEDVWERDERKVDRIEEELLIEVNGGGVDV